MCCKNNIYNIYLTNSSNVSIENLSFIFPTITIDMERIINDIKYVGQSFIYKTDEIEIYTKLLVENGISFKVK